MNHTGRDLIPVSQQDDHPDSLHARVGELEALLGERTAELDRLKLDLAVFKARYRRDVGELHEQLEELELAIAEAELGEITRGLDNSDGAPSSTGSTADRVETAPRYTSDAVRRLFRDVAKAIHPDLAADAVARDRRHALMIEANRAYATGDEERLRWILQAWERSAEAVGGNDPEAATTRLVRRISQLEEQVALCNADVAALKETPLAKLKAMVDESAARGKDLVADTVRRLKRDIMVARNRLEAIQSRP